MEENENIEDSSKGWINWWEFAPVKTCESRGSSGGVMIHTIFT